MALYIPLGMSGHLALRRGNSRLLQLWAPVGIAFVLSGSIEMAQVLVPGRYCSAFDWMDNVIGSAVGVAAGVLFERIAGLSTLVVPRRGLADRPAIAVLCCWVASLVFPLYPTMSIFVLGDKLSLLTSDSMYRFLPWISAAICWFAAGRLLRALGATWIPFWLALSSMLIPAQLFIATRQPRPDEFIGAVTGIVLFWCFGSSRQSSYFAAWAFLVLLILRGLAPFQLAAAPRSFGWIPFDGFLAIDWQPGIRILLEKSFYYGAAIWLVRASGMRLRNAVIIMAAILAAIEAAQTLLPGRTPEITDPVMAILLGLGIAALGRGNREHSVSQ